MVLAKEEEVQMEHQKVIGFVQSVETLIFLFEQHVTCGIATLQNLQELLPGLKQNLRTLLTQLQMVAGLVTNVAISIIHFAQSAIAGAVELRSCLQSPDQ